MISLIIIDSGLISPAHAHNNADPLPVERLMEADQLLEKAEGKAFLVAVLVVFVTCQLGG